MEHLGEKSYSWKFPLITSILMAIFTEFYAYEIAKDPKANGLPAIFVFIGLILYFSFREGIRGGFTTTLVTLIYYLYIIYTRNLNEEELNTSIETTFVLGMLYFFIAGTVGWLRQTLDHVIERELEQRQRLETIIQQLPVGIVITDKEGKVVQVNRQIKDILGVEVPIGYQIGENTITKFFKKGIPVNGSDTPIYKALKYGDTIVGDDFVVERNGRQGFLQVSAAAIHNREDKVIAAATIIADNTPQKEVELRKDDFVNMASHELKTPLTSMKLYIDSLEKRLNLIEDLKANEILINIKDQTARLQKLVNDLLDVSRLQTGKLTFELENLRLDEVVEDTINLLQNSTRSQKIILTQKDPLTIYGDKFRLYQVITNLITNAIKYSHAYQDILVKVYKKDNMAIVSVQDFGLGIAKEEQQKIFERLYQINDDTIKTFPGFGMGLFISREIITRHRGEIWVESEKGRGSTFYFSLPLIKYEI